MAELRRSSDLEGVAIVAMACRVPGADSPEELWENLRGGVESIRTLTEDELEARGIPSRVYEAEDYVPAVAEVEGIDLFDAGLFGFNAREAELMDPQHRVFLECAWEALERAGCDPGRFPGRVGVFAGTRINTYAPRMIYPDPDRVAGVDPLQLVVAVDKDYLPTLVSYKLNLTGPSLGVQSACSTGLVAVHLACESLMSYQCDLALAGSVSLQLPEAGGYLYREGGIVSPDGHCRAFDAAAGGTVFGSGLGIVILKRLADAVSDGDPIVAVIRGAAINNDGARKVGYTAPSVQGQAEVILTAHRLAGVAPEELSYVEAHGTGTAFGDPVEVAALKEAFGDRPRPGSCALGSVKTNLGHLDTAAGIVGLIKTALMLSHGEIPPSLHFERPNPEIDFEGGPFFVNDALRPWDRAPRRAGVSSFGIGGTNTHVVLEEAPTPPEPAPAAAWQLLVLSAASEGALDRSTARLAEHLDTEAGSALADVAFTLQVGRRQLGHRRAAVCEDTRDAVEVLRSGTNHRMLTGRRQGATPSVAFLFPGQGTQHEGMGRGLYASEAPFRREVDRCCAVLKPHLGFDLGAAFDPSRGELPAPTDDTAIAQPLLFVVEYALARTWMTWGVRPAAMLGHSVGEYVAACLAGACGLEEALGLIVARGRAIQELPRGAMLSVSLTPADVEPLLGPDLALATVNGPSRCVVSGPAAAIEDLESRLRERRVGVLRLPTSHAFHSPMVEPAAAPLVAHARRIDWQRPKIPYVSNVTGSWIEESRALDPEYWGEHLVSTVRFADALDTLLAEPRRVLLEVGPGHSLISLARSRGGSGPRPLAVGSMRRDRDPREEREALLGAVGRLWVAGVGIDWEAMVGDERRRRVRLPGYSFERQSYWLGSPSRPERQAAETPGPGPAELADWFHVPVWRQTASRPGAPSEPTEGLWVLFGEPRGLAAVLTHRLLEAGDRVLTVERGPGFERLDDGGYRIDPTRAEDYDALFRSLRDAGGGPWHLVHLWSLGERVATEGEADPGFYELLFTARALGETGLTDRVALSIVTDRMWAIEGGDQPMPERATLLGPARVVPLEYPGVRCRVLEISRAAAVERSPGSVARVVTELASGDGEPVVAYRGRRRWIQEAEAVRLEPPPAPPPRLRRRGVYLVTGGLGGVGGALAAHLAREVEARLILMGRTRLPDRADWDRWLEGREGNGAVAGKIRSILELEGLGAEVLALSADVTDEAQMRSAVERATERFGTIHGVIHGAGVAGGGSIQFRTREEAEAVLAPKVRGTRVLSRILEGRELDFFALLSSTIGLTGALGQVDYCAANAFLDAFAQSRPEDGPFTVAIDWDQWSVPGMGAGLESGAAGTDPSSAATESPLHPLLGQQVESEGAVATFRALLSPETHWLLDEHRVLGEPVLPGAAYLEMVRAAVAEHTGQGAVEVSNLVLHNPLHVPDGEGMVVDTVVRSKAPGTFEVEVASQPADGSQAGDGNRVHASAEVAPLDRPAPRHEGPWNEPPEASENGPPPPDPHAAGAIRTGERWHRIRRTAGPDGGAFFELPEAAMEEVRDLELYPPLVDLATAAGLDAHAGATFLPLAYRRVRIYGRLGRRVFSRWRSATPGRSSRELVSLDVVLLDPEGVELASFEGFSLRRVEGEPDETRRIASPGARKRIGESPYPISPADGAEALRRVLAGLDGPQVAVSPRGPIGGSLERGASLASSRRSDGPAGGIQDEALGGHRRPDLATPYTSPRNEVERSLAELWGRALGFDEVGIHDDFFELGGHSVLAVQLMNELRDLFGVELPLDALFEASTVARLADVVVDALSTGFDEAELGRALEEVEEMPDGGGGGLTREAETGGAS